MSEDSRRRRRPLGTNIESEIRLSRKASARFVEVMETTTTDPRGRPYADRMREKAASARRKHAAV